MEKHLFIVWNDSIKYLNEIIISLSKKFQICSIFQNDDILIEDSKNRDFLIDFYWNQYHEDNFKNKPRFTSKFVIIIVNDLNPIHINYNTSQRGETLVNKHILEMKHELRKIIKSKFPLCHASDDVIEFIHNLKIILKYDSKNKVTNLLNYYIKFSTLLLENKINFLKFPKNISEKNKIMWNNYLTLLGKNYNNLDLFCIDSSFSMTLHKIRDAADLTYICGKNIQSDLPLVKNHKNIIEKNSNLTIDDIIFNPEYHFYCRGLKCLNLETLKIIKNNRNTDKDKVDCKLIDDFLSKSN